MEKIKFVTEEGQMVEFFVEEQTMIGGTTYLLVSDSQGEEAEAYIMKDVSDRESEHACYEFVEDENEFEEISKIFELMMDDVDFI